MFKGPELPRDGQKPGRGREGKAGVMAGVKNEALRARDSAPRSPRPPCPPPPAKAKARAASALHLQRSTRPCPQPLLTPVSLLGLPHCPPPMCCLCPLGTVRLPTCWSDPQGWGFCGGEFAALSQPWESREGTRTLL